MHVLMRLVRTNLPVHLEGFLGYTNPWKVDSCGPEVRCGAGSCKMGESQKEEANAKSLERPAQNQARAEQRCPLGLRRPA